MQDVGEMTVADWNPVAWVPLEIGEPHGVVQSAAHELAVTPQAPVPLLQEPEQVPV